MRFYHSKATMSFPISLSDVSIGMHVLNNSWNTSGVPAHAETTWPVFIALAAQGGSTIIRVPTALSNVTASGVPGWVLDTYVTILQAAQQHGLKVIFEPGRTPLDLLPAGASVSDEPQLWRP